LLKELAALTVSFCEGTELKLMFPRQRKSSSTIGKTFKSWILHHVFDLMLLND